LRSGARGSLSYDSYGPNRSLERFPSIASVPIHDHRHPTRLPDAGAVVEARESAVLHASQFVHEGGGASSA